MNEHARPRSVHRLHSTPPGRLPSLAQHHVLHPPLERPGPLRRVGNRLMPVLPVRHPIGQTQPVPPLGVDVQLHRHTVPPPAHAPRPGRSAARAGPAPWSRQRSVPSARPRGSPATVQWPDAPCRPAAPPPRTRGSTPGQPARSTAPGRPAAARGRARPPRTGPPRWPAAPPADRRHWTPSPAPWRRCTPIEGPPAAHPERPGPGAAPAERGPAAAGSAAPWH